MPSSRLSRSLNGAIKSVSVNVISDIKVDWRLTGEKSPVEVIFDGMAFLEFSNEDSQEIHTEIRIPNNYVSARPIRIVNGPFFTNEIVGTIIFKAEVTLIRPSETVQGQYDNIFSSGIELEANPTLKEYSQIDELELTSPSGVINSIVVKAKDILRVRLYRDIENEVIPCEGSVYLMKESFIAKAI